MAKCNVELRLEGAEAYPRTCAVHGLGPCLAPDGNRWPSDVPQSPEQPDQAPLAEVGPLSALAAEITEVNLANGWFESSRAFSDDIALLGTEVSEAYEAYRYNGDPSMRYYSRPGNGSPVFTSQPTRPDPLRHAWEDGAVVPNKPEGVPSEIADVIIRALDTCYRYGINPDEVVREKINYNRTRGHRHGGKVV